MEKTKQKKDTKHLIGNQHNKLPLDKAKSQSWKIRCTAPELTRWSQQAAKAGMDRSAWTRHKLNED